MKLRLFANILAASAIAFSSIATISQPSNAQAITEYFCGKSKEGVPTTYARRAIGKPIPIIRWVRTLGKYTPQVRCQEVSGRFQAAYQDDALNYITTSRKNNLAVLCSTRRYGEACSHVLLTLRPDEDVNKVVEDLKNIGGSATGPIKHGPNSPNIIDMNKLLREAKAED